MFLFLSYTFYLISYMASLISSRQCYFLVVMNNCHVIKARFYCNALLSYNLGFTDQAAGSACLLVEK